VKRLLAVVLGAIGLGALLKRRQPAPEPAAGPDPADGLRAKLAETRVPEPEPEPEPDVADRRADVHERARQAIDELKEG
jgi:hypothetical protein